MSGSRQPAIAQAERRLDPRYAIRVPIQLQYEGRDAPVWLETTNLSLHGCNVMMAVQLPVGIPVQAQLCLEEQVILIRGRVVTRHPESGNGIMFLELENDGEERLRAFLDGR